MGYTIDQLHKLSNEELDAIYCEHRAVEVPHGIYKGRFIRRLNNKGARLCLPRVLEFLGFQVAPFGIDFRSRRWYFFSKRLQAGRFAARAQHSRWRDTETVTLDYGVSRLPPVFRNYLYDEVKPLGEGVLLGLGGINREVGLGDHFFFSLELIPGTARTSANAA